MAATEAGKIDRVERVSLRKVSDNAIVDRACTGGGVALQIEHGPRGTGGFAC